MQLRPLGGWRAARVGHNQRAAVALLSLEVPHDGRHRLGEIPAHEQDGFGVRNVLEGKRKPAIETERLRRSSRSRRHAESAVVVDVRRAQRDTRELSEQIRLLVGQRPSAEHANSVAAVGRLRRSNRRCDPIDRALPRRGIECACRTSHERREQPLGVANRLGGGPSLEAQPTFIDGKSLVACDLDAIAVAGDVHAALKRAVRTMSRDSGRDGIHPCPLPAARSVPRTSCRNGPASLRVPISKCSRMSLENDVIDKYERKHARSDR